MAYDALYYSRKFKRRRMFSRLFFSLALLAVAAGGVVYLFYLPYFRIRNINVSGMTRLTAAEIAEAARGVIAGKVALVLPADNIFILPKSDIVNGLRAKLLRIKELDLTRQWPATLNLSVAERDTWAVYCNTRCFLADRGGFLFDVAPDLDGSLFLKIYDERGTTSGLGDAPLERGRFGFLADFRDRLEGAAGEPIVKIFLKKTDIIEFHFAGWYTFIDGSVDLKTASENLALTLSDIGDKKSRLEYVDLRLPNKIFIKYQGQ